MRFKWPRHSRGFSFKTYKRKGNNLIVVHPTGADKALVTYRFPFEKGEVRAYFQQYGDAMWAHVRRFEPRGPNGEYLPTKGIAVYPDQLNELLVAVASLVAKKGEISA